jgi:hypothetical protein
MPDVLNGDAEVGGILGEVYTVREDLFAGTFVDGKGGSDTLDADGLDHRRRGLSASSAQ